MESISIQGSMGLMYRSPLSNFLSTVDVCGTAENAVGNLLLDFTISAIMVGILLASKPRDEKGAD